MNQQVKFDFEGVVFFGRCINEYVDMFNLDLNSMRGQQVLDCSSGPAAFAVDAAALVYRSPLAILYTLTMLALCALLSTMILPSCMKSRKPQ